MIIKRKQLYIAVPISLLAALLILLAIGQQRKLNYISRLVDANDSSNGQPTRNITPPAIKLTLDTPSISFVFRSPKPQSAGAFVAFSCDGLIRTYISEFFNGSLQAAYAAAASWLDLCSN